MASITRRGDKWRAQAFNAEGKRKSASFTTKAAAQQWVRHIEAQRDEERERAMTGRQSVDTKRTFRDLLDRYADEIVPRKRGARHDYLVIQALMRNFPDLADTPLVRLRTEDFSRWRDTRCRQVAASTVVREMVIMSHALNVARREWRWIDKNPLSDTARPKTGAPRDRRPSQGEIERLIVASGYDRDLPPVTQTARSVAAFLFCCETALRAGELCNLLWEDVHQEAGWLSVRGEVAGKAQTKTGHSRVVPLTAEAKRILDQLKPVTKESGRVLNMKDGTLSTLFRKVRDRAGMTTSTTDDLHFHDSRREALTRLAPHYEATELAKISGHMSLKILLQTYYAPTAADLVAKMQRAGL